MSNTPMSDTQEKQTQEIYRVMQLPYLSERHDGIKQLIDSAKREGAIEELRNLPSERHETSGWCNTGFFIDSEDRWERIKQLEQSEESK